MELDDHCDKLAVERRYCQLTDDGPVYHALSVHICRAKLITRFDDQYAVAKFSKCRLQNKILEGSILISGDTRIAL